MCCSLRTYVRQRRQGCKRTCALYATGLRVVVLGVNAPELIHRRVSVKMIVHTRGLYSNLYAIARQRAQHKLVALR